MSAMRAGRAASSAGMSIAERVDESKLNAVSFVDRS
jgi:hypothetical protein